MKMRVRLIVIASILVFTGYSVNAGYYQDAFNAYQAENYDEAIAILKEGLQAAPNDEDMAKLLGQIYFKIKKIEEAENAFQKAVSLDPDDDVSQYYLGLCFTLRREGNQPKPAWFEASQAFAKAVELQPDNPRYNYQLGHSQLMLRKYQLAQAPLEKAYQTEEGRNDFKILTDLGLIYQALNETVKAIDMFEKAIELSPDRPVPYFYLGNLYIAEKNYDKTREIGDKLIEMQPQEGKGYSFRGYALLMAKDFAAAEATFNKAIELDPTDGNFYYQRGLAREGKIGTSAASYKSLIDDYAKAVSLAGSTASSDWHYKLGNAYELEATLDWDRAFRHAESRANCLRNLRKAQAQYNMAKDIPNAQQQLLTVNERIRQLEVIR
ncbi:tetratricopeptide repeat protein [bacterium]|nr:tetratricopeptide repeat protein [candidate division CSSED10-310 bacterium]